MTILDLTIDGELSAKNLVLYNAFAYKIHKPFTDFIDSISKQHTKSIDWWVSSPASRNTIASPLFHYCCCIALLQELIRTNEHFTEIITDSRAVKKIIENYLAQNGVNVRVTFARVPVKQRLKELVRPIYTIFGLPLKQLLLFFAAQLTRSLRKPFPSEPLTLIDTFVMPGYIEKDRYYPGLLDSLSEKEKKGVWFVPYLYGFRPWQFLQVVKRLRKSERNFLFKDDFLKFKDYWCLWGHLFRVRKLQVKPCLFQRVDISLLLREELTGFRGISSSYAPLLNFCFVKKLKQAGVNLRLVIDWFENQNLDRGWNAGFRRYYPKTLTRGYQGFVVASHYLCMYPTKEEKKNAVIPHEIMVIGKGVTQSTRKFCHDLQVMVAPAFRFQQVWEKRKFFPAENESTILVALPIMVNNAIHILSMLSGAKINLNKNKKIQFWIKPHPTTPPSVIKKNFGVEWPKEFEFISGDFNDCVEKSNLLISSVSSACMETLAKGIPVIIIGNSSGLTYNPIPETITNDIWRLCYSSEDITKAIQFYKSRSQEKIKEHEEAGRRIREEYFEPVTREGVRRFLGLE